MLGFDNILPTMHLDSTCMYVKIQKGVLLSVKNLIRLVFNCGIRSTHVHCYMHSMVSLHNSRLL